MKKMNKIVSIILALIIILPGMVDASGVVDNQTTTQEVMQSETEVKETEVTNPLGEEKETEVKGVEVKETQVKETQVKETQVKETEETIVETQEQENLNVEVEKEEVESQIEEIQTLSLNPTSADNKYIERINGKNRVETSIEVSKNAYKGKVNTVLLAGHDGQADALTATFVAGQEDAPLLLTYKDRVDPKLLEELTRLKPNRIVILGGESVVNKDVENALKNKGFNVQRITGSNRIETAINVATEFYDYKSGLSNANEVFLIEYDSLIDALAIGPVAARDGIPILITKKDSVPNEVAKFLQNKKIKKATIIGGESKISKKGKASLDSILGANNVGRISGDNRVQTSINICEEYFKSRQTIIFANGTRYTDALIGGYFAAKLNAPIILTNDENVSNEALACIGTKDYKAYVLGGTSIINNYMYNVIRDKVDPNYSLPVKPGTPMVFLDYGHGGIDSGAVLRDENGKVIRMEKDDTLLIGLLVAKELRRHGVIVDESRTTDKTVELAERSAMANKKKYNYFVSFHRNSNSGNPATGVETFSFSANSVKATALAKEIQKNLVEIGFRSRGAKYADFSVLRRTNAPAVLMEIGFINNPNDNILFDKNKKQMSIAISSAILGELGINYKN